MQCLPHPTGKNQVHCLLTVEADEAETARPFVVVVIHDNCVLHRAILLKIPAQRANNLRQLRMLPSNQPSTSAAQLPSDCS